MGQIGSTKKLLTFVFLLVLVGGYFLGYHTVHTKALDEKHHAAVVHQQQKVNVQNELEAAWKKVLQATPPDGDVNIAVYDHATGATATYSNAASTYTFNTASIVKLSILETTLWQDQQQGLSGLTSAQLTQAEPMIENSDNDAATDLWNMIGGTSAVNAFFQKIGATNSTAGTQGLWGLTQTTAPDQLKVVNEVAYPSKGTLLTPASAAQANSLMDQVESDQRWGVTGGVPSGVSVELKNGWLDDAGNTSTDGWNINSIGHVHGDGVDYTIAVLTDNDNTMQDGVNTIQSLSTATWNTLNAAKS